MIPGTPELLPAEVSGRPSTLQALTQIEALITRAQAVEVTSPAQYQSAVELCGLIAAEERKLEAERLEITRPMDEAKRKVMEFFTARIRPLQSVDTVIRNKLRTYTTEQRRLADIAKREAEEAARKEREALEARAREEARKAQAKAEQLQREAEAARRAGDEAAALKAETRAARVEERAEQKVQGLQDQALMVVAPIIHADPPKAKGAAQRKVWRWRVIDESKLERMFLKVDEQKIDKQVKALKRDALKVLGEGAVEVWEEDDISIRAAKS